MVLLPVLHASVGNGHWLLAWHLEPSVVFLLCGAGFGYVLAYRSACRNGRRVPPRWQVAAYLFGLLALAVALLGPVDHFNGILFSMHMVQHLILMLVAPPLILLGRPVQLMLRGLPARQSQALLRHTVGNEPVRRSLTILVHPVTVFVLYNGSFVLWHLPGLYQAAVRNVVIHEIEHAIFFTTALLFWWVLIDPVPRHHRLSITSAAILVFATWMATDLLCAAITLANDLFYPIYGETTKPWGLTPLRDQRIGGLVMWAGGGVHYALVLIGILALPYLRPGPVRSDLVVENYPNG